MYAIDISSVGMIYTYQGYGLDIEFIDHLYTPLGTTSNYSAIATFFFQIKDHVLKKVMFSLCSINLAPHHEDVWRSGNITTPFLTLVLDGGAW
jgi:hypothetical protein